MQRVQEYRRPVEGSHPQELGPAPRASRRRARARHSSLQHLLRQGAEEEARALSHPLLHHVEGKGQGAAEAHAEEMVLHAQGDTRSHLQRTS